MSAVIQVACLWIHPQFLYLMFCSLNSCFLRTLWSNVYTRLCFNLGMRSYSSNVQGKHGFSISDPRGLCHLGSDMQFWKQCQLGLCSGKKHDSFVLFLKASPILGPSARLPSVNIFI